MDEVESGAVVAGEVMGAVAHRPGRAPEEADEIRKALQRRGIVIEGTADTTRWWFAEEVTSA
jgi:cysteinyl-tRNA synthetase